jgi:hypothetical protein
MPNAPQHRLHLTPVLIVWRCRPQVGGLLSFNIIFPSDSPDIARLMG